VSRGTFRPPGGRIGTDGESSPYRLPTALNGDYSWIQTGSLVTHGDVQYAVWVDDSRKARIAKRTHGQGWTSTVDLSTVTDTALSAQFTQDSHNYVVVGVDSYGYVHVSGNMHAGALKYMRTAQPGKIDGTWVASSMIGTEEASVTYPEFVKALDGDFYFWYRDGGSGDGDHYLNKWNPIARTWSRIAKVIDGKTDDWSAYPQPIAVDQETGRWHMLWTWRLGPTSTGPEDNRDVCYAYSDDEGTTWRKTDGSAYTLPITKATGEVIVAHNGGLTETILNGGTTAVDGDNRPHSTWIIADVGGVDRYHHIYHDGAAWQNDLLLSGVTASRRPVTVCFPDGRLWMLFSTSSGSRGNRLRAYDIDGGTETVLLDVDLLAHEPATEWSSARGTLYAFAPYERQDGAQVGDPADLAAQTSVPVLAIR
jgi:hypothetical protein